MGVWELDKALEPPILAYYDKVAPLIEHSFAGAPIVYGNYPSGFGHPAHFRVLGVPLSARALLWACHRYYAVEFHTWAPLPHDEDRLRFARILIEAPQGTTADTVCEAASAVRAALADAGVDAIPLLGGITGMALWVPFADAPHAEAARAWLHRLCGRVVAKQPRLVSTEPNSHADGRAHLHVSSNAPGRFSALPYSLRGTPSLPVCTPIEWKELATVHNGSVTAASFAERLAARGDVFAHQAQRLSHQRFAAAQERLIVAAPASAPSQAHGHITTAAIQILGDGKVRSADEILAAALERQLVPPNTNKKYVYTALIEYIARQLGHGRKPAIVQTPDRRFRINEPPDDWPDLNPQAHARRAVDAQTQSLIDRLDTTAAGDDPTAFELAVCDAFAHLGFAATHLGGNKAPDGYADAQLGVLGYRVMLECKTGKGVVNNPDVPEAAKYQSDYHAGYCALVGHAFSEDVELQSELRAHGVAAFTVEDLRTLLALGANAHEMRPLFAPGFASDALADLLWNRAHGESKRVADVAALVRQAGWSAQLTAAAEGGPANAPHFTEDAAMIAVDQCLRSAGSAQACTRSEVRLAFDYLTNPLTGAAIWADDARTAIVILSPPES
ncbi:MAG: hypothetical protein KGM44_13510 [bacterium]|nr:hypothetical protein [bacterium]